MHLLRYFYLSYPARTLAVCFAITIASLITAATLMAMPVLLISMVGKETAKVQMFFQFFEGIGITPTTENMVTFLLVGITIQSIIFGVTRVYAGFTVAKIVKDLRIRLLTSVSKTEWKFFTNRSSGAYTAALVSEAERSGQGYRTIVDIVCIIVQMFAYLTVAFLISWEVATIAIVTSLLLVLLFSRLVEYSRRVGADTTIIIRKIVSQLTDSYRSIKPLKAMAREQHVQAVLDSYAKQLKVTSRKSTIASETLDMLQEIILMSTIVLTVYFSFRHLDLPLTYGFILVILYLRSMKFFGKAQKLYQRFVDDNEAYKQLIELIELNVENAERRDGNIQSLLDGDICFQNLSFSHPDKLVLNEATAIIHQHKLNSFTGPSGAGKTTLVDLLCGLHQPNAGQILIDNIPLADLDINYWRQQIGYVTQENSLLNSSISDNVTLGDPSYTDDEVLAALAKSKALEFVNELPLGIGTVVGENGAQLSGGQRQRILIARALVHSPRLLILDEATSALDSETELALSQIFKELSREITVISISHRPAIVDVSDHVYELNNGKLVEISA